MKGTQQFIVQSRVQSDLRRDMSVEVLRDVFAIHALRGGCQSKQNLRFKLSNDLAIGIGSYVMHLVNDDIIVVIIRQLQPVDAVVDDIFRGKDMGVGQWGGVLAVPQFTEIIVAEHHSESAERLLENLLTVGYEQQSRVSIVLFQEPLEVQCGDHSLTRSRGCYDRFL